MTIHQAKATICSTVGLIGGWLAHLYGGWTAALGALLCCMAADYITGLIVAGVFHSSIKSSGGGLDSRVGWKGLSRKFVTLLIVLVAHQMDILMGTSYIRDSVIIGFAANEVLSVIENAALMGLPMSGTLKKALDQLTEKGERENG